jgi:hypothetical protein
MLLLFGAVFLANLTIAFALIVTKPITKLSSDKIKSIVLYSALVLYVLSIILNYYLTAS